MKHLVLLGQQNSVCTWQFRNLRNKKKTKGTLIADLPELNSFLPKPVPFKLPLLGNWTPFFLCVNP